MTKPNLTVIEGGSPWMVDLLTDLLKQAKEGQLNSLAVAWGNEDQVKTGWILAPDARQVELLGAVDLLHDRLRDHIRGK